MTGRLLVQESGATKELALGKDASVIALAQAGVTLRIGWDPGAASWTLEASEPPAGQVFLLNGQPFQNGWLMRDGDVFSSGSSVVQFSSEPELPRVAGNGVASIPLKKGIRLVFGRADGALGGPGRVELDADDPQISREHAVLWEDRGRFHIKDESQDGTLLNGQRFEERTLILGDRFQIGGYAFEFTGLTIERVKRRIGGRVDARDLGFVAGGRQILQSVNLEIAPCSFVGILGGSGQGKSTLMNALCGINPATTGEVRIEGEPVGGGGNGGVQGIGYVPQDDIVHAELTVEDAITFSARLRLGLKIPEAEIAALVSETILRLGLDEHRKKRISNLSGGQRKRVSIATELLDKPSVLFLDEPSSGLDPATEYALMKLLRRLAGHDCTVVCTTHVLGRAYLFDRIVFVHGGRIVFNGSPDEAVEYFGVETLDQVYVNLDESGKSAEEWEQAFLNWRAQVGADVAVPVVSAKTSAQAGAPEPGRSKRGAGYIGSLVVQLQRLWEILIADRLNPVFLVAQPVLIGILVGWVAEDFVLRLFMCVVATLWFGCSNGAQQIVKERPIFRRERVCGLGLNAYLQSKYVFHGLITTMQALALILITQTTALTVRPPEQPLGEYRERLAELAFPTVWESETGLEDDFLAIGEEGAEDVVPDGIDEPAESPKKPGEAIGFKVMVWAASFLEVRDNLLDSADKGGAELVRVFWVSGGLKILALALTALVGVAIGLAISGVVQTSTQAVMWVPLILIPQILFGGVVLKRAELSQTARWLSYVSPSYSCQRVIDVSNLIGRAVPMLTNRTKLPIFLTAGEKERVQWQVGDREFSETYDRVSPVNTSWQNLTVFPTAVGEHRHEFTAIETRTGSVRKLFHETVTIRTDVLYPKGVIYQNFAPLWRSLLSLFAWTAFCYFLTLAALIAWQKGK